MSERHAEPSSRVTLRPVAAPIPLGYLGLAAASFTYAGLQLGWIPADERALVGVILVAVPVPMQLIAALVAFPARDGPTAAGLGLLATTWLGTGLTLILTAPGSVSSTLGLLLLVSAAGLLLTSSAATLSKLAPAAVLALAGVRFALGGVHQLTSVEGWQGASAVTGLALTALALYTAWAMELEDASQRTLLPLGRRGIGRRAVEGTLDDQLEGIEHEAGVRRRL